MSIWLCPACMTLTGPTNAPCPKCGSAVERAIIATGPAPMPDDSTGPVQFQPFNPERADAAFAEYARNDALSCKECRGSGMTTVMRYTSACLACKGTGRIPSADPGQTHYEGCERTAGHHRCALDKLDAAQADAERYRWIRDTFHAAKGGASLEVNHVLAYYETLEPGKEVEVQWYPETPIGFYKIEAATLDEAIDRALAARAQP